MRSLTKFLRPGCHRQILFIAGPMILSNLTSPLMGLVDTAVLGHLDASYYLAGASLAALFITQLYWLCGFLRMTSTGLSAQARGKGDKQAAAKCLTQAVFLSLCLALLLIGSRSLWLQAVLLLANASSVVNQVIQDYFLCRIWGAPAALANLALIGWLIGQQQVRQVLWIQVVGNLLNAILSVTLVVVFELNVKGVALATVLAEYSIMLLSFYAARWVLPEVSVSVAWLRPRQMRALLGLNGYTFVRNIVLQLCLAFLVFQGMRFGETSAALNAILLQFFSLIALGLDGIAYSAEALVGERKGQQQPLGIAAVTCQSLLWSLTFAVLYSVFFAVYGSDFVAMLTPHAALRSAASEYSGIVILLPLCAHWSFLLDGVFVGLTRAKAMQNSMLLSALLAYLPVWLLLRPWQNQGLWLALLAFLLARGLSLGGYFIYLYRRRRLVA